MKKLFVVLLVLNTFFVSGQTNPIASVVEKPFNHMVSNMVYIPQQGISYLTQNWTLASNDYTLHYHDLQGKYLWSYSPNSEQKKYLGKAVVGSEYSDLTYLLLFDKELIYKPKKNINITRINRKGEAESLKLSIEEDMDKSTPIAAFANSKGFYFLIAQ